MNTDIHTHPSIPTTTPPGPDEVVGGRGGVAEQDPVLPVIPAQAGNQPNTLDSRLRGNDGEGSRLRGNDGEGSRLRGNDDGADLPVPAPLPAWRRALEDAVRNHPKGRAGVADQLGVSRVYVSRVMSGHMSPVPVRFVERVNANLCRVECPHLGRSLAPDACRSYAARPYKALAATEVDHWRACQRCPAKAPPETAPTSSFGSDAADRAADRAAARATALPSRQNHRQEVSS